LRVDLIEGRVAEIRILGARYYRSSLIRKRLARGISDPLNVDSIEAALRILDQDPRIGRVQARLVPGDRRAEARLEVVIDETMPVSIEAQFDNYESPTVGSYGGQLRVAHSNLFGQGDRIETACGACRRVDPLLHVLQATAIHATPN
jgi:hemolysin activation/secretion protein